MVPSAGSGGDAQPRCQPGGQGASRCGGTAAPGEHTNTHTHTPTHREGFVAVQPGGGKAAAATTVLEGPGRDFSAPCPSAGRRRPRERGQTRGSAPQSTVWRLPRRLLGSRNNPGAQRQGEIPSHPTPPYPLPYTESSSSSGAPGGCGGSAPRRQQSAGAGRAAEQPRRAERSGAELPLPGTRPAPAPAPARSRGGPADGSAELPHPRNGRTEPRGLCALRSRLPPPAHCTAHAVQRC